MNGRAWDTLREAAQRATEAMIIAPYVKTDATRRLLLALPDNASITCVTRWTLRDLQVGASDINCATLVMTAGGEFRLHPQLHAKYYRFDTAVLIGSANLTSAGIGIRDGSNIEILCDAPSTFDAAAFEDRVLQESLAIDADDIEAWEMAATLSDTETPTDPWSTTGWNPGTRDPEDVWMAYQGLGDMVTSLEQRGFALGDLQRLALPAELTRDQFDALVRARLLSSAPIYDVLAVERMSEEEASALLERQWNVERSVAYRRRETVRNWIAAFLRP